MKSKAEKSIERISNIRYVLIFQGICIGVLTGIVVSFFRQLLVYVEGYRTTLLSWCQGDLTKIIVLILVLIICWIGAWLCLKLVPLCGGSGIPQVAGELKGKIFQPWGKIIIGKIIGAALAIGGGLSLGREGPSIQIGAMIGKGFSSVVDRMATEEKLLITCGAAAGLSGAFSAPLAGVIFALEELHNNFSTDLLLGCMAASISSDFIAYYVFGLDPVFSIKLSQKLPLKLYWTIVILGVLLGFWGMIYVKFTEFVQDLFDKIPKKIIRLAVPFALVIPIATYYPWVLGGGYKLINQAATGEFLFGGLVLLMIMKFSYSIISFGSGAPGGIFMPLLVIGGITGAMYFTGLTGIYPISQGYIDNFLVYGMVGYFAAIVRSPVTGVILITEMVGDFNNFLSLSVVAVIAFITADLLNTKPIYEQLLQRILNKNESWGMTEGLKRNKVLINSDVYIASIMDGKKIKEMRLPRGCLVVSVMRGGVELVPGGETELKGGDHLTLICDQGDMAKVDAILCKICRTERRKGFR